MKRIFLLLSLAALYAAPSPAQTVSQLVNQQLPDIVNVYKHIHQHPELSHQEVQTSAFIAEQLRKAGYQVTEHVGHYADGSPAYGVVAILKNGPGPQLLVRTDMDALPVTEQTGLPYASTVRSKNPAGQEVGVMHACGHDIHMATMVGFARIMAQLKNQWHGTLMLIGQSSEETIDGAKAMLADHLYQRFGRPNMAIALHDYPFAAGKVSVVPGYALASSTAVDVVMRGIGAHGAAPDKGKDPVMMAGEFIVALQTVVSRSTPPQEPAVITIGDIHGGTKRNVIPDEVKLELTVRAYDEKTRQELLEGIKREAIGVAVGAGVPQNRMPVVTLLPNEQTPAMYNDPVLSARIQNVFVKTFGAQNVIEMKPIMASEDFGVFGLSGHQIPTVLFWLGADDPAKVAASKAGGPPLPSLHSPFFQPLPAPTLRTGMTAMTSVALNLLQK